MKSYFINNGPVILHILEEGTPKPDKPSLLVVNGLWESAERAIPLLSGLDGHVITFSFRGRGLSSTPETGYGLEDHLSDIAAIVQYCGLRQYAMLGFSRGASYALGWVLHHQQEVSKLILVDQPPVHRSFTPEAVNFWIEFTYQNVPVLNHIRREALHGLGREAKFVDYTSDLGRLTLPVALFVGGRKEGDIPSNISEETLCLYKESLPDLTVKEFPHAGHMIPDEDLDTYILEITDFLA